ncbi:MAG: class I SAM-dependent methyltransferase [Candidatus Acidiferrum sp.]
MPANAAEWDARYREAGQNAIAEPASLVSEWLPMLPHGPGLDIACGTGRHTLPLAARGAPVTAVDWSAAALDILANRAREEKLAVCRVVGLGLAMPEKPRMRGIQLFREDLEKIQLPAASFSVILCLQYLQRSLFPQITRALEPNGLLLFETFTRAQLNYAGGPHNPDYLLERGELRAAFPELRILFYRELNSGQGIASLVARKSPLNM